MSELLLSCQALTKSFGATPLFENLSFGIFEGDHIGVVGPNGSGKTTLLRILAELDDPTSGIRSARKRLRLGYVPQDPVFGADATVGKVIEEGARTGVLDDHEVEARISLVMARAGFEDPAEPTRLLSGGWLKRLAIARELAREPDLVLLDEPTNHLDVEGILWLEELLTAETEAFLAVSHDRYFLEAAAGRIIELNRAFVSGIFEVRGSYSDYLVRKDEFLAGQESYQDSLRNRVRGELDWLSRKARARTRKSKSRIDDAGRLVEELSDLDDRSRRASVGIEFSATERMTRRLLVATGITKRFGDGKVLDGLDLVLGPGTRIGLLGANGSGKTTLLRILAGTEQPDAGTVERAENLRIVTFDQHRSRIEPGVTLRRALAPSGDSVVFQGTAVHVAGWAKRFLFQPEALEMPVDRLSGGEQARVVLARLMLEPADLLLLDEPTNDLDIPTLELLEESLMEFPGAIVLVTHDRYLLDRVSTRILALRGPAGGGRVASYADFAQWESSTRGASAVGAGRDPSAAGTGRGSPAAGIDRGALQGESGRRGGGAVNTGVVDPEGDASPPKPARLGYLEKREYDQMESRILEAEERLAACRAAAENPAISSDHEALAGRHAALERAQSDVDRLYARWAELEAKTRRG